MHTLITVATVVICGVVTVALLVVLRRMTAAYHAERFPRWRLWVAYGVGVWITAGGLLEASSRRVYAAPAGACAALIGVAVFTSLASAHRRQREEVARLLSAHQDYVDEYIAGGHLGVARNELRRRRERWRKPHNH
jgi:hypothetical protein